MKQCSERLHLIRSYSAGRGNRTNNHKLRLISDWDRVEVFRRNPCLHAYKNQASFIVPDNSKERSKVQNKNICNYNFHFVMLSNVINSLYLCGLLRCAF